MSKRILLIDSDESFAQGLSAAATANGFTALTATNSEQGMTLAQKESPDLIVVCVEAQPTNGYMLCTRLKKDDRLKRIPVILTSANATPDSFEKHKKLKTRAEEYLIKPFGPQAMLEKASQLLGIPLQEAQEEIVSMEDESLGLGDLVAGEDEPIQLSAEDAAQARVGSEEEVLVDGIEEIVDAGEPKAAGSGGDDDLEMFDQAFDALKPAGEPAPVEKPRLRIAPKPAIPDVDEPLPAPTEISAPTDDEMLGLEELAAPVQRMALRDPRTKQDKDLLRLKEELHEKEKQLVELQEQQSGLEEQAQQLKDEAVKRDAAAKALQHRADALAAAAKKFERELTTARDQLKGGGGGKKAADYEKLQSEHEELREQHRASEGEKDLLREEREELRKQLAEAKAAAQQNEERAIKAYQKIKSDEKLREKTRKALQIALALLEDGAVESESDGEEPGKKKSA